MNIEFNTDEDGNVGYYSPTEKKYKFFVNDEQDQDNYYSDEHTIIVKDDAYKRLKLDRLYCINNTVCYAFVYHKTIGDEETGVASCIIFFVTLDGKYVIKDYEIELGYRNYIDEFELDASWKEFVLINNEDKRNILTEILSNNVEVEISMNELIKLMKEFY